MERDRNPSGRRSWSCCDRQARAVSWRDDCPRRSGQARRGLERVRPARPVSAARRREPALGGQMDSGARLTLANAWIAAWRRRDVDSLISHYATDVEFRSPLAAKLLADPSGTIRGRENLKSYFAKALAAFPGELDIELLGLYQGVDSIVVLFQARGRTGAELMEFDGDNVVRRAVAHVGAA